MVYKAHNGLSQNSVYIAFYVMAISKHSLVISRPVITIIKACNDCKKVHNGHHHVCNDHVINIER